MAPGSQRLWQLAQVAMEGGEGATLRDVDGNTYIDLAASLGVAALGYGDPGQAAALAAQAGALMVGTHPTAARLRLLQRLAAATPAGSGLRRTQLYSGGAEAVESALRLARAATGKFEVISFWGGFHGKTQGVLGLMGSSFKHGLGPQQPGLFSLPYADCSRCPLKLTHPSCGLACVDFVREAVRHQTTGSVAAIVVEPILGTGGNIIPPDDYLPALRQLADEIGALLVVDEMITGFGRTGRTFAVEHVGVHPDIMTVGKSLGGGYPIAGVITTEALCRAEPWSRPSFSSSSYGGNPLAAAAADYAVGEIAGRNLARHAAGVGERMLASLRDLAERFPFITNPRGRGLMLGFDLVADAARATPMGAGGCEALFAAALRRGVVTLAYAPRVRITPPLVITEAEADEAMAALGEACAEVLAAGSYRR